MISVIDRLKVERVTPYEENYFFGYYDISPESPDGRFILACKAPFIDRMPSIGDSLEVGYFESGSSVFHKIGLTTAWNFQEGCRLQWLSNTQIIYNIRNENGFGSVIYDIVDRRIVKSFEVPVYSISHDRKQATFYGFTNNKYNYSHTRAEEIENKYGDGVYILDLNTGNIRNVIPLTHLIEMTKTSYCKNWVEYCSFSPTGKHYYIYHRWDDGNGDSGTHLCVGDLEGKITTLMTGRFVSHAGWKGDDQITAWSRVPSSINSIQNNNTINSSRFFKFIKKIYHSIITNPSMRQRITNDAYITFNVDTGTYEKINNKEFVSDGHCTWSKNKRFMLTDTYPDSNQKRTLMLYDAVEDQIYHLGAYYSYPKGMKEQNALWNVSGMRCDLHPKWTELEKYIYFDSVHEGYRALYRIDISCLMDQ